MVYWAKYYSGPLSIVVEVCLLFIVVINLIFFLYPKLLTQKYQKRIRILFIAALLFSVFFSALAILPINKPNLVVSPSSDSIVFRHHLQGIENENITVNINSTLGDARNIKLTAEPDDKNNLTAYIDGIKRGPKEIPSIYRGKGKSVVLRIQTSPEIQTGRYHICLNYTYQDFLGKEYKGSDSVKVYVYSDESPTGFAGLATGSYVVIIITMLVLLALRRMLQSNKDH